jgi:chromosome segregation protein
MHQIQKLELVGFKSFCDRTQIIFNEGITSIVGPNGCGKSNIADAIGWVVGEQSAKSLRTDRMEGVIFGGTQARKATGFAEVVLTLSLMDHFTIPEGISLNPDGFTVGRRLYRSGESEYYLDGRRCRLKDIQALFEGTGLGPNSYALIEQGRIGMILSSKPSDRRSLIEEAARITLFKSRKYSAEMKLELAQQNLLRVNDIIREVARQLNSLRRQAAKARRYNRLREELRNLQILRFGMEDRKLRSLFDGCLARFTAAQERERIILVNLASAEDSRTACQELCLAHEQNVDEARDGLSALKTDIDKMQILLQNGENQRASFVERGRELDREQLASEERRQLVRREETRLTGSVQQLTAEINKEREFLDAEQSKSELLQEAIRQTESETEGVRTFLINGAGRLSDLKNLQTRCQENLQRIDVQTRRLKEAQEGQARERARLLTQLEELRNEENVQLSNQKSITERRLELEDQAVRLQTRQEQISAEITARQEELSLMQHRFSSLEEVERRRSNYSEGVQKFLSSRLPGEEQFQAQTLADQIETDPTYEKAIEDYLNDPLQYILVDGLDDAIKSVDRLRRVGAGKCTFMTLRNGHGPHKERTHSNIAGEGVIGLLDDLLHMKDDVRHAFERVLPDFASTVMVSDLPTAFRIAENNPGANFLTLSGESYSPRGTLSAVGEHRSMAGFLALKREKRELTAKMESVRNKLRAAREELEHFKKEASLVAEELKSLAVDAQKLEVGIAVIQHRIQRLEEEISRIGQTEEVAGVELSQLESERADFEARLNQTTADISAIEERSRLSNEELKSLTSRTESLRIESSTLSKAIAGLASDHAVKQERKSSMEGELRRLAAEGEDLRMRVETMGEEKQALLARIEKVQQEQEETKARIAKTQEQISAAEIVLSERQQQLATQRESLVHLEEQLRHQRQEREEAMEARGKIEIEKTRLESDLEHVERSCQEEFHTPLDQIVAQIEENSWQRDYEEVVSSHEELRTRIENFGAINMRALEEYQELDERYQFLNSQRTDIEKSIADTQKAIAEINKRSIEQFQDAFQRIRENFIDVFQILFRGGQCDLRLLDDGDVLESGIDIIAQPPGKRLQNVLLLSGGEKALTALALLIAIFRYRPSPFCVLDEVDAPLDDANVDRFTQLVSELSKDTQFLIITHNKKTMEIAQTLYGVTMEEPGVSKIVGVDFRSRQEAIAS